MLEASEKRLGAHTYSVTPLGAIKGRSVLTRLLRTIGPALATAAGEGSLSGASIIGKLVETLKDEDVDFLCETFAVRSSVHMPDGRQPQLDKVFDVHFAGNYGELIQWLLFCLEVNFGGFFADALGKAKAAMASALPVSVPAKQPGA